MSRTPALTFVSTSNAQEVQAQLQREDNPADIFVCDVLPLDPDTLTIKDVPLRLLVRPVRGGKPEYSEGNGDQIYRTRASFPEREQEFDITITIPGSPDQQSATVKAAPELFGILDSILQGH